MLTTGQHVTWLHQPRGGYGYIIPVPAVVLAVRSQRVKIQVSKRNGQAVCRWVQASNIREATT